MFYLYLINNIYDWMFKDVYGTLSALPVYLLYTS